MRSGTIAFLLGICWVSSLADLPGIPALILLIPAGLLLSRPVLPGLVPAFFILGILWALVRAEWILQHDLNPELEGKSLQVTGDVISLPEVRDDRVRFEFRIDRIIYPDVRDTVLPGKVRLNWYRTEQVPQPGERWQLVIRIKRPHGFMNPGGFDYERWLFQHGIRATGYVVNSVQNRLTGIPEGQFVNRVRYLLRERIMQYSRNSDNRDLLVALALGDRSYLDQHRNTILTRTGTSHLLAISGLHIGLVSALAYCVTVWAWSLGGILPAYLASKRVAIGGSILAAFLYALMAGFTIPTQRAVIMTIAVLYTLSGARNYPFSFILGLALLLVLIINPFVIFDPGLWLSFIAVGVIAFGMLSRSGKGNFFWRWGRVQYLVTIGLIPVLILWFQQLSVIAFLANLLAVPWVGMVVVPLILAGTVCSVFSISLASLLFGLADSALQLVMQYLDILAGMDMALWYQAKPAFSFLCAGLFGTFLLIQPAGIPARWIGIAWLLPLFFSTPVKPGQNELWFTLLDTGQGLAAVIQTHGHVLVYDTGNRFSEYFNAGDAVVIPFLRHNRVRSLDKLVISHSDIDHSGGVAAVLAAYPGTPVMTNHANLVNAHHFKHCYAGQQWTWDGVHFEVLHPEKGSIYSKNNQSCVIRITSGKHSILLTGDIEKEAESHLVRNYTHKLASTVLVAPHHGSKTSSTDQFIDSVNPEWVLFPVGYLNRFKLPNEDIIDKYRFRHIHMLDTASHGAIQLSVLSDGIHVESYRQKARKFWHAGSN